jgi:hypothetical protein
MKHFVSGIDAVLLSAALMIVAGILLADLPWSAFVFVSGAAVVALWLTPRNPRSFAQLFRHQGAQPVPAVARGRSLSPTQPSDRKDPRL